MEDKLAELFTQAQTGIAKVAPQALQLAIEHERWEGIGQLAIGAFFVVLCLITLVVFFRMNKNTDWQGDEVPFCIIPGIVAILTLIVSCWQLLNVWNWVAVINPKLVLAHDVIVKLTSR